MDELNLEHRLTEVEQRTKSNTHRLDGVEPIINEIHTMSRTMVQLVNEIKHTNEAVKSLDVKVERMDSRVDSMEKAPAQRATKAKDNVSGAVLGAIAAFLAAGLIWAAVQAF